MIHVAIVGCGAWGLNQVRAFAADPRCVVASICDPNPLASERATEITNGVAHNDSYAAILDSSTIDAVVIATPAPSHARLALAAMAAGKHVLIEKPMAMTLADGQLLAEAAAQTQRTVMVGHLMVYHPVVVRLRAMLVSGELGALHYLHTSRVNLGRIRRDENALWSFGPHDLSMIDYLMQQMPLSVSARGQCVLQSGIEDVVFLTLRFANGEMAHLHLSWLHPRKERRLTLVCAQKMVEFDDVATDKLRIYDKGYDRPNNFTYFDEYLTLRDGDVHIPQVPMEEPLRIQTRHFIDCVSTGATPRTDVASGLRVTRVLDAAQRSLQLDGVPVQVL
ncbi:MAG: Gfo/Idh/MocA family oxidoreductase [Kofleriaceae bacterium]|nr:Gfo/Idh/MocA family oxidoreductase [Kofleriaceae bacterium]